jgi:GMP synthase (glutamine-hydrolysing)
MAILVLEHSSRSGIQRFGRILRDYSHRLRIVKLHEGDPLPPDLDDVDGIVSCGGPQSAADDSLEWLEGEMDLIRQAHERDLAIVGLCLGSQITARALGGTVERMPDWPEIGWHPVKLTAVGREDPVHAGLPWEMTAAHWHGDQVAELPPDARLLASSDRCKVQAWSAGLRTYCFQYHPEIDRDSFNDFVADSPDALQRAGLTPEALREDTGQHYAEYERLTNRLFESLALFVMPVDRRYKGLLKDLHH